jgi:predicted CXXCH cytochrome family protein
MTRARTILLSAAAAAGLLFGGMLTASEGPPSFPHEKHDRLFPVCEGCHAGITTGDRGSVYPEASDCAQCHDGERIERVEWQPPGARMTNVRFSHQEHATLVERSGETATCQSCHASGGAVARMEVGAPQPELCTSCHAHAAETHFAASATCSACHAPLTELPHLSLSRVASFSRPSWHDEPAFISRHGREPARAASCATCHARETCERCHANGAQLPLVRGLAHDPRVRALERGKTATYPTPSSHDDISWRLVHGERARAELATCANCHTRSSCTSCHMGGEGTINQVVAALPLPVPGMATGVVVDRGRSSVHPVNFGTRHGIAASSGQTQCAQCHSSQTCATCHAGQESRAFHAANFVERHATDVFAGTSSCQSCHSTEAFCRDCHVKSGVASRTGMNSAFHTGQPMWILSHGQAARMGMESCASCHRQSDCVRCHSANGGWGVSPHGPGFPASRLSARSSGSCAACHASDPRGGR